MSYAKFVSAGLLMWAAGTMSVPVVGAQQQKEKQDKKEDIQAAVERIHIQDQASGARFDDLKKEILECKKWALETIYDKLGLYLPSEKTVTVVMSGEFNPNYAAVTQNVVGRPPTVRLYLPGMLKTHKDKRTLMHELVHAIQFCCLSVSEQAAFPHPFFEGLAVYANGDEGMEDIQHLLKSSYRGSVERLIADLRGLSVAQSKTEYCEGYLAIRYLAEKYGADKVKQFAREVTYDRTNYKKAIEDVTGGSWDQFQKAAREYTVTFLKGMRK